MQVIEIHADDYCLSHHGSEDILNCIRAGKLDSISVLTNMTCYEEFAEKYIKEKNTFPHKPLLTVHLNFMEGHCLAEPALVPHLVDENGYFNISWATLFIWNYSPKKIMIIKKELKEEIKAQTEKFIRFFGNTAPLRFDGHQHTQMIPLVYWALLEVIVEQRYYTQYIRITREPVIPYLSEFSLWKTYKPVNWIKNILLNFLATNMEKTIEENRPDWQCKNTPMFLWGVVMSGHMDSTRFHKLLPKMKKQAEKKGRHLEILFHPGTVLIEELTEEFCNKDANEFHISSGRHLEYETVMSIRAEEKE